MNEGAELRLLLDRAAISDLMLEFSATLDRKDWDAYGELFLADASFTIMGQTRIGRADIIAGPARDHSRYDTVQHFSANHRISVDGDEASASHYMLAVHVPEAGRPELHADAGGRYDCRCVRSADGWRFAAVELSILWLGGEKFELAPVAD